MSGYNPVPLTDVEPGNTPAYADERRDEENPPAGAPTFSAKSLQTTRLIPESANMIVFPAAVLLIFTLVIILGRLGKGGDLSSLYHELHEVKEELEDLTKEIKRLKLAIEKGH